MILALTVAVLAAGGTYLVLQRSMVRAVFGIGLLSHAGNFVLLTAGVPAWRGEPLSDRTELSAMADPLPQAFVLTAIVITLAVTVIMLMLAVLGHNDDTHLMPSTGETHDS
ncbi:multisubunit sodium/proton antiporter, MrpC subunit [Austwickia chelonae]|uniref:Na(+)/H(+) antiporter subunit C n=1 Tax=Austwickia chelonae NBRC 105200 TaxID=1184607 RepID=K6VTR0_9MICO|nr:cation:proton antiporter subunit C [Austwickia chelonae]GAB78725.1 Na(+)/H(+) antiporter subunit C [Austwickia chelonae NBRC 105200]SEW35063.1 multisubunit sodium/proton antiporter, MrpC subunit [Austwickia chelonae]